MRSARTGASTDVEALIAEFRRVRGELVVAVASVAPELRDEPFVGTWDVKDVIAHTVGWDHTNVEALPDFRAGRVPAFFARYDSDWAAINAGLISRYRVEDWHALMASLRESGRIFVDAFRALTGADLDNAALWGERRISLRGMMRAVSRDESEHVSQVREFVARLTTDEERING